MTERTCLHVQAILNGKVKKMYEEIKEDSGIGNNSDTIRFIIVQLYSLRSKNASKTD